MSASVCRMYVCMHERGIFVTHDKVMRADRNDDALPTLISP